MSAQTRLHLLPCCRDPATALVEELLHRHAERLPDLSDFLILCPAELGGRLQQQLLAAVQARGRSALLPPAMSTPEQWLEQQLVDDDTFTISPYRRELILVRELRQLPDLYGSGSPWQLATQLLQLFDELGLSRHPLEQDYEAFVAALGEAYELPIPASGLEQEARLVHSLWQAWQAHQAEHRLQDVTARYLSRLAADPDPDRLPAHIYMIGEPANLAELDWLHRLGQSGRLSLFCQFAAMDTTMLPAHIRQLLSLCDVVDDGEPDIRDRFYNDLFSSDPLPLRQKSGRWQAQAATLAGGLPQLLCSRDGEQLAQGISEQCGLWLQQGIEDIHIVCEDRKLARRLRALLERRRLPVQDLAGWALSTTSYAALLERWLQTVEEDFYYRPLLDLLKSPAMIPGDDRDGYLRIVYRFEHEIVRYSNIPRGLRHYRNTLQQQTWDSLRHLQSADGTTLETILTRLEQAGELIRPFTDPGRHPGADIIKALIESLRLLGMYQPLAADEAGARILQELELMQLAGSDEAFMLDWAEFRAWLGFTLERYNFTPPGGEAPIRLMNLEQSRHLHAGALVIAAAEARFLPGTETPYPFFNDRVRAALGLPDMQDRYHGKLFLFRRLLSSATHILIARREQENGEDILPCPWLQLLDGAVQAIDGATLPAFHGAAAEADDSAASTTAAEPPPQLSPALAPAALSATDLQMLMGCPYRFYAARGLGLSTPEAVSEQLEKSDFGARVHKCLQAFHEGIRGLPGPFQGRLDAARRDEAMALMETISEQVFFHDLEDNFVHRAWHYRWLRLVPDYINWQIGQEQKARFHRAENGYRIDDSRSGIALKGRIDRLDRGDDGLQIIDYKTGTLPRRADVESGEVLQLPFYALLAREQEQTPVRRALYLGLEPAGLRSVDIGGDRLDQLTDELAACVDDTRDDLNSGSAMPAWGNERLCRHCDFGGLCRKSLRQEQEPA